MGSEIDAEQVAVKQFDAKAVCSKCGNIEVSASYHAKDECKYKSWGNNPCNQVDAEHLLRTCRRCGFGWYESPLRAPAARPAKGLEMDYRKVDDPIRIAHLIVREHWPSTEAWHRTDALHIADIALERGRELERLAIAGRVEATIGLFTKDIPVWFKCESMFRSFAQELLQEQTA